MEPGRSGDLVLPQGTYVLLQDGASGQVEVVTGPHKVSLADTDKPVVYEKESRRFAPTPADRAIRVCPAADEGQYIILTNPTVDEAGKSHPKKGKQSAISLTNGRKINIQGPDVFALFPGQIAEVLDGHQLKSNEYLLIRVYNEKEARTNLKNAVVKTAEAGDKKGNLFDERELRTGNLLIIKGTDVSFYIPPTGIEVLEENGNYVRNAVTLERLEYCILLDQNGDKRYVKGPDVVFPKPTETFVEHKGQRVFRAVELNENMGIYIKVIADYEEKGEGSKLLGKGGSTKFIAGEELFITGKEQKIYFPRAEHAVIKYGDETIHYATAVPIGEGRYILDKTTGSVNLIKGPKMLLPDPRTQVIVKRVLNDKTVNLWFPGNTEALKYNQLLEKENELSPELDYIEDYSSRKFSARTKQTVLASAAASMMADELTRKTNYTKPRSIKLDTKYEGAVLLNIWPNYAVQIVNKTGDRRVVEGPKVVMLAYDETLEVLELSTGKPKNDNKLKQTVYLQTKNNIVSDIITVETKDLINVDVLLSYKVNFEEESTNWFNVSDYVKLLTQHMRSLVRNAVKKQTIEEFNEKATDLIRDIILGKSGEGKRKGRSFEENGMTIYDVEVLNLEIGDEEIAEMLVENQHNIVEQNLKIVGLEKNLEFSKKEEEFNRQQLDETIKTNEKKKEVKLQEVNNANEIETTKLAAESESQVTLDNITAARLAREQSIEDLKTKVEKERSEIRVAALEREWAALQPRLIEALIGQNDLKLSEILAKNLKEQKSGLGDLLGGKNGGFEGLLETVKGTNLESRVKRIISEYSKLGSPSTIKK